MEKSVLTLFDPPTQSSPTREWQDFLAREAKNPDSHPDVQRAVKEGHAELERRKSARKKWWVED